MGEACYCGRMDQTALQVMAASFGMGLGLVIRDQYLSWKHGRDEITYSRDWRGRMVRDRKVKLFERSLWWIWGIGTIAACIHQYFYLTS